MAKVEASRLREQFLHDQVRLWQQTLHESPPTHLKDTLWVQYSTALYGIWNEHISQDYSHVIPWKLETKFDSDGTPYLYSRDWNKSFARCIDMTERNGALGVAISQVEHLLASDEVPDWSVITFTSCQGPTGLPNTLPYPKSQTYAFVKGDANQTVCFTLVTDSSLAACQQFMHLPPTSQSDWDQIVELESTVRVIKPSGTDLKPIFSLVDEIESAQTQPNLPLFNRIRHLLHYPEQVQAAWNNLFTVQKRLEEFKAVFFSLPDNNPALLSALALNFSSLFDQLVATEYRVGIESAGSVGLSSGCLVIEGSGNATGFAGEKNIVCPDCGWTPTLDQIWLMKWGLLTKCPTPDCEYDPCTKTGKRRQFASS